MREEDFDELLRVMQRELRLAGLLDLASIENYRRGDDAELDSRDLITQMLKAFELHIATLDRTTYRDSMKRIRGTLGSKLSPKNAVVEMDEQMDARIGTANTFELSRLSSLLRLRKSVQKLAGDLRETPYRGPRRTVRQ